MLTVLTVAEVGHKNIVDKSDFVEELGLAIVQQPHLHKSNDNITLHLDCPIKQAIANQIPGQASRVGLPKTCIEGQNSEKNYR